MYLHDPRSSGHRDGGCRAMDGIQGSERRLPVSDSTQAPYRWICALEVHFLSFEARPKQVASATGFLISPRHVLTAASNLSRVIPRTRLDQPPMGKFLEPIKVVVTPGLDGSKLIAKKPAGSIDLKPGDWWIHEHYPPAGDFAWDVAVLTLPRELSPFRGMPYGYWGDDRFVPRTMIGAATPASLLRSTVSTCGYPGGTCVDDPLQPFDTVVTERRGSTLAETSGTVQAARPTLTDMGLIVFDAPTCDGMTGGPVWQTAGGLRAVALHEGSGLRHYNVETYVQEQLSFALTLRPEILDAVRQRVTLDRIRPAF